MVGVGSRKFVAFLISMAVFCVIMMTVILMGVDVDLSGFAFQLGTGIMVVSGPFYAGNVWSKRKQDE